jgi:DNA-binding winged helix-turn-helix (wHTH) protein
MRQVWPDAFVEEGNLNKNISVLRKTLGQWDGGREYIETVPKRGYRFAASVNEVEEVETNWTRMSEPHRPADRAHSEGFKSKASSQKYRLALVLRVS